MSVPHEKAISNKNTKHSEIHVDADDEETFGTVRGKDFKHDKWKTELSSEVTVLPVFIPTARLAVLIKKITPLK